MWNFRKKNISYYLKKILVLDITVSIFDNDTSVWLANVDRILSIFEGDRIDF